MILKWSLSDWKRFLISLNLPEKQKLIFRLENQLF